MKLVSGRSLADVIAERRTLEERLALLATGESRALRGHTGPVESVDFFPDGRALVSTGQDGSIRLWPDELPWEPEALRTWLESVTSELPMPGVR